ncbi:hypothetical protein BJ875DRAFT_183024 [Amylocarpus encephaloides]|uniref:Uncharacterized protein n=1 Tax=Amylocarpus encephaloides TaxID=45428 RepID=A0A9P7Y9K7_9HELO|nr:hypothetical protein BJ875DRAFT_183024 [Amylocarpus encephaloides]
MRASFLYGLFASALPGLSLSSTPLVAHEVRHVDVAEKRHFGIEHFAPVEGRADTLGTFDLAKTFPAKKVLVQVALGKSQGQASESISLTAFCLSCFTTGKATVTSDGVKKDDDALGNFIDFLKNPNPEELVVDALDLAVTVNLENLGGHFEIDLSFGALGTYTIPLFKPSTPVGAQLDDKNKIGLLFTIELVLAVSGAVDFTTGFDFSFPKGASFTLNPLNGDLISMNIDGAQVNAIPVKFKSGAACVSATLRLKFQAALALEVLSKGFDFEAGVFFDPLQYKACVTFDPSKSCPLEFTQSFFEEIGAYAKAAVDLDFASLSAGPTAVSTFFTGALPSACISTSVHAAAATTKAIESTTTSQPEKGGIFAPTGVSQGTGAPVSTIIVIPTPLKNSSTISVFPTGTAPTSVEAPHWSTTATTADAPINNPPLATGTGDLPGLPITTSAPYGNSTNPSDIIVTEIVVTSTTVWPFTSTHVDGAQTSVETGVTTSTILSTITSTVCTKCSKPTALVSTPSDVVVTEVVVTSTTVCPFTSTHIDGPSTSVETGITTSTILSTVTSTVCTKCSKPTPPTPSDAIITQIVVSSTTICPYTSTHFDGPSTSIETGTSISTIYSTSTSTICTKCLAPPTAAPIIPPSPAELTTRTIYDHQTITITSCSSQYIMCPAHLATQVVETIPVVQYTTICPVSQTSFPTAPPPPVHAVTSTSAASTSIPTFAPTIVITSPISMTPIKTPIIRTLDTPPPPIATTTFAGNVTVIPPVYPVVNTTSVYIPPPATLPITTLSFQSVKSDATSIPVATGTPTVARPPVSNVTSTPPPILTNGSGAMTASMTVLFLYGVISAFAGFVL